jgi:hypothetical protein
VVLMAQEDNRSIACWRQERKGRRVLGQFDRENQAPLLVLASDPSQLRVVKPVDVRPPCTGVASIECVP